MPQEVDRILKDVTVSVAELKAEYQRRHDELEKKLNRIELGGAGTGPARGERQADKSSEVKAFERALRTGLHESKAATMDDATAGGLLVPDYLDKQIGRIEQEACPMRRVARVISVDSVGYEKLLSVGGTTAQTVGEREERPETDASEFVMVKPAFCEMYAQPAISQRLLDDASHNLSQWMVEELGLAFGAKESAMFATGTGVKSARGMLSYPMSATPRWGELLLTKSGSAGAVVADRLFDVVFSLKSGYRSRASWLMCGQTISMVRQLKDNSGRYLFLDPTAGTPAGAAGTLLGYPVYEWAELPAPAADSHSILFGDWFRGFTIADVTDTSVLRDPYTRKGFVLFYATKRVGSCVEDSNAIVVHQLAA